MPLHSILANDIAEQLVTLGGASLLISLVMAFVMGFSKGFRRVSWSGLIWLIASVLCIAVCEKILTGEYGFKASLKAFAVAAACVLAVMAVFGFLASLIRPKVRWVKDNINGDTSLAEFGLEFEPEYVVYDGEDDWKPYG